MISLMLGKFKIKQIYCNQTSTRLLIRKSLIWNFHASNKAAFFMLCEFDIIFCICCLTTQLPGYCWNAGHIFRFLFASEVVSLPTGRVCFAAPTLVNFKLSFSGLTIICSAIMHSSPHCHDDIHCLDLAWHFGFFSSCFRCIFHLAENLYGFPATGRVHINPRYLDVIKHIPITVRPFELLVQIDILDCSCPVSLLTNTKKTISEFGSV